MSTLFLKSLVFLCLLFTQVGCLNGTPSGSSAANASAEEQNMLSLMNEYRASFGLSALSANTVLTRAAQSQSQYMDRVQDLTHTQSPPLETSDDRIRYYGGGFTATGEVIAYGYLDAASTLAQWKSSPSHRNVIVSPSFRKIGISRTGYYWSVTFGN